MELVSLGKEVLQSIAEHAASYRLGQSALRHLDRALWVVEKCARWAVPPPLDPQPQPELVRPLPWVFFLAMLVTLRVTRESISLVNLVLGKPPLRSADVVSYIQSKRRYLRTLKYSGTRLARARAAQPSPSWLSSLYSLFELTMCFRRQSHLDNNNTTRITSADEVVVVKRQPRGREERGAGAGGGAGAGAGAGATLAAAETTMERLIEKMMVDLDNESDEDDSTYTLTNISSPRTDRSECTTLETDPDTVYFNESTPTSKHNGNTNTNNENLHFSPNQDINSSTPKSNDRSKTDSSNDERSKTDASNDDRSKTDSSNEDRSKTDSAIMDSSRAESIEMDSSNDSNKADSSNAEQSKEDSIKKDSSSEEQAKDSIKIYSSNEEQTKDDCVEKNSSNEEQTKDSLKNYSSNEEQSKEYSVKKDSSNDEYDGPNKSSSSETESNIAKSNVENGMDVCNTSATEEEQLSDKQASQNFLQNESKPGMVKKEHKMVNGRTVKSVSNKKKGGHRERQQSKEVL